MSWLWLSLAAFGSGLLGSMGMGGGGILVIFLALFTNLPQSMVQGINLLFFIPIGLLSVIMYQRRHLIKWRVVLPFAAVGVCASLLGAFVSNSIDDAWLRRGFGVLLLVMGVRELFTKNKKRENDDKNK